MVLAHLHRIDPDANMARYYCVPPLIGCNWVKKWVAENGCYWVFKWV